MKNNIFLAYGTRPEIIKLSPVIQELRNRNIPYKTVFTGQHRELYEDVKDLVHPPDYSLNIMIENQSLTDIVSRTSSEFSKLLTSDSPNVFQSGIPLYIE